jgi:hypothetical protein
LFHADPSHRLDESPRGAYRRAGRVPRRSNRAIASLLRRRATPRAA